MQSRPALQKTALLTLFLLGTHLMINPPRLALGSEPDAPAGIIEIFPGQSFEAAVESLAPGDTLIVHEGTYADSGRISIRVNGTASDPVVIMGAAGENPPLIMRPGGAAVQNTINIEGASHVTIRGFEITSNGGDGIKMVNDSTYITLEDNHIHQVDVGINFKDNLHHITVRRNHIHNTGAGGNTGEGMYVGCHDGSCVIRDSLIEGNWIHDTLNASQGDGIEIKKGSHSNIIRDNVIYDTHYPCILLYGTQGNPRNLVEGNVMWNCGDSGIQVAADTLLRNNIILDSPANGLNSQYHNGVTPANVEFVHNTIIGGSPCLRLSGWDGQPGMVLANNAVYCDSGNFSIGGLSGVTVAGNVVYPSTGSLPSGGYTVGRSTLLDFLNAANKEVYPTSDSPLVDGGDPAHTVPVDFNGTPRTGSPDAGAYNWTGPSNPGWPIHEGFKDNDPGGLAITKLGGPLPAIVDHPLTYTLTTQNLETSPAAGVVVTDTLPANVDYLGASPTQGSCRLSRNLVICDLGEVPAGSQAVIEIVITPQSVGSLTNTAIVTSSELDLDPSNNTSTHQTYVFSAVRNRYLPVIPRN